MKQAESNGYLWNNETAGTKSMAKLVEEFVTSVD